MNNLQMIIAATLCFFLVVCGFIFYLLYMIKKEIRKNKSQSQIELMNELNQIQDEIHTLNHKSDYSSENQLKSSTTIEEKLSNLTHHLNDMMKTSHDSHTQVKNVFEKVNSMNDIMVNKKTRGNWGEYQLNNLLSIYAGHSQEIYETQYSLKNGYIGDVALHLPDNDKVLIIDSKFPQENYQNLLREDIGDIEREKYKSLFKQNIKKHINDIYKKYITPETMESAVMFIPSEAIYFYVCSECSELIDYAHTKHILITSPTTLLGVVFTLVNITKDMKRNKNIKALEKDIVGMYEDVVRLSNRLDVTNKTINKLQNSFKDVNVSSEKIINRVVKIHDGYSENFKEENKDV